MSKQQLFLLVFMVGLCLAALPGIMIGTPESSVDDSQGDESQLKELTAGIRRKLPDTELELEPTSEKEKEKIIFARKININEAEIDQLQEIPGVGSNTARRIINFRESGGTFYRLEDLDKIKLIGEKTVEDLRPHVTVGSEYKEKSPAAPGKVGGKIDVNEADASRLTELTGVGAVTAKNIISYRKKHGGFASLENLKNVRGIGPKTLADMRDKIEISGASNIRPSRQISSGGKINVNRASAEELKKLPGIGAAYAERIVEYRNQHGDFTSLDELTNVSGIGPVTVSKLKEEAEL